MDCKRSSQWSGSRARYTDCNWACKQRRKVSRLDGILIASFAAHPMCKAIHSHEGRPFKWIDWIPVAQQLLQLLHCVCLSCSLFCVLSVHWFNVVNFHFTSLSVRVRHFNTNTPGGYLCWLIGSIHARWAHVACVLRMSRLLNGCSMLENRSVISMKCWRFDVSPHTDQHTDRLHEEIHSYSTDRFRFSIFRWLFTCIEIHETNNFINKKNWRRSVVRRSVLSDTNEVKDITIFCVQLSD